MHGCIQNLKQNALRTDFSKNPMLN